MHSLLLLLEILCLLIRVESRTECFLVTGRLKCPTDPDKAVGAKIDLMDEDSLPMDHDDLMGRTWSIENGTFAVSGCGSDAGPFNTPDGYLRIVHTCPHRNNRSMRSIEVDVLPIFLPKVVSLGTIYLDRYMDDPN